MKNVNARKVCWTDMSDGHKNATQNQTVPFIYVLDCLRTIQNTNMQWKTYFNNVIHTRLCYNKILTQINHHELTQHESIFKDKTPTIEPRLLLFVVPYDDKTIQIGTTLKNIGI